MPTGRAAAWIVLAVLVAGGAGWPVLHSLVPRVREQQAAFYGRLPDRATLEYPRFLAEVQARTPVGATIAIVVPRGWDGGYDYAYYRAVYLLEGRKALPVRWRNRALPENLRDADYVAVWRMTIREGPLEPVWTGFSGTLYERESRGVVPR